VVDIAGSDDLINTFVKVKITDVSNPKRLQGQIVEKTV
jgi:tRNA-2-methylthio-N6-dimethylallyladenosine synthase